MTSISIQNWKLDEAKRSKECPNGEWWQAKVEESRLHILCVKNGTKQQQNFFLRFSFRVVEKCFCKRRYLFRKESTTVQKTKSYLFVFFLLLYLSIVKKLANGKWIWRRRTQSAGDNGQMRWDRNKTAQTQTLFCSSRVEMPKAAFSISSESKISTVHHKQTWKNGFGSTNGKWMRNETFLSFILSLSFRSFGT